MPERSKLRCDNMLWTGTMCCGQAEVEEGGEGGEGDLEKKLTRYPL